MAIGTVLGAWDAVFDAANVSVIALELITKWMAKRAATADQKKAQTDIIEDIKNKRITEAKEKFKTHFGNLIHRDTLYALVIGAVTRRIENMGDRQEFIDFLAGGEFDPCGLTERERNLLENHVNHMKEFSRAYDFMVELVECGTSQGRRAYLVAANIFRVGAMEQAVNTVDDRAREGLTDLTVQARAVRAQIVNLKNESLWQRIRRALGLIG